MRLLIVGGMKGQLGSASKIAIDRGAKVASVDDIPTAMTYLRAGNGVELVMIDVALDIGTFIEALRNERIVLPVVACGVANDAQSAVRAIKAGAKEYIPLPPEPDLIAAVLEAATQISHALIFRDPAMGEVLKLAEQVAPSNASILITGESGTGKEVVARHIHGLSRRKTRPFVSVNCAAIPESLLESELFGHEKGAFTGAIARRIGKFEEADGGTLLLDEISEMDVRLQAKLLRAIQEREIDRVGGTKPIKVDIRILATSNRELAAEAKAGRFREDLLFRLNVVHLKIPPLRQRPGDISALCDHFIRRYADLNGVPPRPLSITARDLLGRYAWPGNVRELENTMHRAVLLAAGDEIDPLAIVLPDGSRIDVAVKGGTGAAGPGARPVVTAADAAAAADPRFAIPGAMVGRTVSDVERDLIIDTLHHCFGNRTHAANILGISIRTLRNKLKQYSEEGLPIPAPGEGDNALLARGEA